MTEAPDLKPITAWAVLGATHKYEPPSLHQAVIYPFETDKNWLERTFPGRFLLVRIEPLGGSND